MIPVPPSTVTIRVPVTGCLRLQPNLPGTLTVAPVANPDKSAYEGRVPMGRALSLKLAPGAYMASIETPRCVPMAATFVVGTRWDRSVTIDQPGWPRTIRTKFGWLANVPHIHVVPTVGIVVHAPSSVTNVVLCVHGWDCMSANRQRNVWYFDTAFATNNRKDDTLTVYEGRRVVQTYSPTLQPGGLFERLVRK